MRFKIKEIGDNGLSLDLPISAAWLGSECPDLDAVPAQGGLRLRGQLLRSGDDVFLRGTLRGALAATCARCLEPARVQIDVPLAVTFVARDEDDAQDAADDDKDLDVVGFDGVEIDLNDQVRDEILLAYPITTLCRETCAGLCVVCGSNRNQVACNCQPRNTAIPVPLAAALAKLKM
jgi:uncharacterized protein